MISKVLLTCVSIDLFSPHSAQLDGIFFISLKNISKFYKIFIEYIN